MQPAQMTKAQKRKARRLRLAAGRVQFEAALPNIRAAQKQGITFDNAIRNVSTLPGYAQDPYAINKWLRELGVKQLSKLVDYASQQGYVTPAEMVDARVKGHLSFRNTAVWKTLVAAVNDDLPEVGGVQEAVRYYADKPMKPYLADVFNDVVTRAIRDDDANRHIVSWCDCSGGSTRLPFSELLSGTHPVSSGRATSFFDGVSGGAVRSFLCPERYTRVFGCGDYQAIAVLSGSTTFTLTTNAAGNAAVQVFFKNCTAGYSAYLQNLDAFDPKTGVGATSTIPCQFSSYYTALNVVRATFCSVRAEVVSSVLNSSGLIQAFPFSSTPTGANAPYEIPQDFYPTMPYYVSSGIRGGAEVRLLRLPLGLEDQSLVADTTSDYSEGVMILVTGATPSTSVLSITLTQTFEYVPTSLYRRLVQTFIPPIAPATSAAINALLQSHPEIMSTTLSASLKRCEVIPDSIIPYNQCAQIIGHAY